MRRVSAPASPALAPNARADALGVDPERPERLARDRVDLEERQDEVHRLDVRRADRACLLLRAGDDLAGAGAEPVEPAAAASARKRASRRVRNDAALDVHERLRPDRSALELRGLAQELVEVVGDVPDVQRRH